MNTAIYHFTGTGNSLKIARDLADSLGETKLVPLARATKEQRQPDTDSVGIVFPVYAWGAPSVVVRFLDELTVRPGTYVFAVCTCAASAGATLGRIKAQLGAKGVALSAGFVVAMPSNYIVWGRAPSEMKQQTMFARADARVAEICAMVRDRKVYSAELGSGFTRIFSGPMYRISIRAFRRLDRKFTVNEACNGCGVCERVCQVNNIRMTDGRPEWLHQCEQCLACLHWCPQEAIDVGTKTQGRARYHHPAVKAKDLM